MSGNCVSEESSQRPEKARCFKALKRALQGSEPEDSAPAAQDAEQARCEQYQVQEWEIPVVEVVSGENSAR